MSWARGRGLSGPALNECPAAAPGCRVPCRLPLFRILPILTIALMTSGCATQRATVQPPVVAVNQTPDRVPTPDELHEFKARLQEFEQDGSTDYAQWIRVVKAWMKLTTGQE